MTPTEIIAVASVASAFLSAIGLGLVGYQLRAGRKVAIADLIVRLEADWTDHQSLTYQNLLPNGSWSTTGNGPTGNTDQVAIESYLLFFETLAILIERGLIPLRLVDRIFAYRFFLAMDNSHVMAIYRPKKEYWQAILKLYPMWKKLREEREARALQP